MHVKIKYMCPTFRISAVRNMIAFVMKLVELQPKCETQQVGQLGRPDLCPLNLRYAREDVRNLSWSWFCRCKAELHIFVVLYTIWSALNSLCLDKWQSDIYG